MTDNNDTPKQTAFDKHNEDPGHLEQRIRELAYRLWDVEGRPDDKYWNRAQEVIQDETKSAYPPSASRGNRTSKAWYGSLIRRGGARNAITAPMF